MRTVAVVNPVSLLARELRQRLDDRPDLVREQRLLTTVDEEVGTLTESGGGAAMVQKLTPESLAGVDLVFLCGPAVESRKALAEASTAMRAVILSLDATNADGPPLVAGVNLAGAVAERVVVSPHPGAVLLAHLLHPLRALGLRRAEATLLQPVSVFTAEALDQLFEQARALLTFQKPIDSPYWQRQLVFNALATEATASGLRDQVEAVLGSGVAVSAQVLQAGIFHGFAASVHVAFDADPGASAVRDAYADSKALRWADEEPLGPADAAAADEVLLGHVRSDEGRPGEYWLWAVMDNLTRGGATNAIAVAEAQLAS
jgi:aspartate-semialdehyde dehydrogenase